MSVDRCAHTIHMIGRPWNHSKGGPWNPPPWFEQRYAQTKVCKVRVRRSPADEAVVRSACGRARRRHRRRCPRITDIRLPRRAAFFRHRNLTRGTTAPASASRRRRRRRVRPVADAVGARRGRGDPSPQLLQRGQGARRFRRAGLACAPRDEVPASAVIAAVCRQRRRRQRQR